MTEANVLTTATVDRGLEDQVATEALLALKNRKDASKRVFDPRLGATREEAIDRLELIRRDLGAYGEYVHGHAPARHHRLWIDLIHGLIDGTLTETAIRLGLLGESERGTYRNKLLLLAPPASAKSSWCSIALPTWYLGKHPDRTVLFFTSSDPAAVGFGNTIKILLEQAKEHREVWPDQAGRPDKRRGWSSDGLYLKATPMSGQSPAYRAVGWGASVMGQRANLLCLTGDTLIETRVGPREIRSLGRGRESWVDVLSYSHERGAVEYRRATPHPVRIAHRLYEVVLGNGRSVRATAEHPFYVRGRGYVRADGLRRGDALLVRDVPDPLQGEAVPEAAILLGDVRGPVRWLAASATDDDPDVLGLSKAVPTDISETHRAEQRAVLLEGLSGDRQAATSQAMCDLWGAGLTEQPESSGVQPRLCGHPAAKTSALRDLWAAATSGEQAVLRACVRGESAFGTPERRGQQPLHSGAETRSLRTGLPGEGQAEDPGAGSRLPDMRVRSTTGRSSPQRGQARQPGRESGVALQAMPHQITQVRLVHYPEGVEVYNLAVEGTENFFANGVLTHNCIDDPMNQENAESPIEQAKAKKYFDMTIGPRLQPGSGAALAVMTRWAEGDLASHFIEKAEQSGDWLIVALPMIAEDNDPIGRKPGDLLWPEQFSRSFVEMQRRSMGAAAFACVYQAQTAQMAGDVFSDERWFKPLPPDFAARREKMLIIQGVDVAFSEKDRACFTVVLTLGLEISTGEAFIMNVLRERMTVGQTEDALVNQILTFRPSVTGIEDTAFKHAVTAELVGNVRRRVYANIVAVPPREMVKGRSDKVARARLPAQRAEAGLLYADKQAHWWPTFINEVLAFPRGRTNDQVDALSLAMYMPLRLRVQDHRPRPISFNPH